MEKQGRNSKVQEVSTKIRSYLYLGLTVAYRQLGRKLGMDTGSYRHPPLEVSQVAKKRKGSKS